MTRIHENTVPGAAEAAGLTNTANKNSSATGTHDTSNENSCATGTPDTSNENSSATGTHDTATENSCSTGTPDTSNENSSTPGTPDTSSESSYAPGTPGKRNARPGNRILIAEDDADNNTMLREYLETHGYACTQAFSGSEAKLLFSIEEFDLILLDLMLPGIAGEELLPVFSQKTPVIVISAKSSLDSKVGLLSAGAEDYLCKPFDLPELLVRIQVQLRRQARKTEYAENGRPTCGQAHTCDAMHGGANLPYSSADGTVKSQHTAKNNVTKVQNIRSNIYTYREWTLDADAMEMTAAGKPVVLTRHEFLILELLIRNPRRVFSKQMIYEYVCGAEYLAEDKTINVHISNIRSKLKESGTDSYIQTVWGMGFKLL